MIKQELAIGLCYKCGKFKTVKGIMKNGFIVQKDITEEPTCKYCEKVRTDND